MIALLVANVKTPCERALKLSIMFSPYGYNYSWFLKKDTV